MNLNKWEQIAQKIANEKKEDVVIYFCGGINLILKSKYNNGIRYEKGIVVIP